MNKYMYAYRTAGLMIIRVVEFKFRGTPTPRLVRQQLTTVRLVLSVMSKPHPVFLTSVPASARWSLRVSLSQKIEGFVAQFTRLVDI